MDWSHKPAPVKSNGENADTMSDFAFSWDLFSVNPKNFISFIFNILMGNNVVIVVPCILHRSFKGAIVCINSSMSEGWKTIIDMNVFHVSLPLLLPIGFCTVYAGIHTQHL